MSQRMESDASESVVVGIIRGNNGGRIGVEVFDDFDAFHENGPEIESRDHVSRVELAGKRGVIA